MRLGRADAQHFGDGVIAVGSRIAKHAGTAIFASIAICIASTAFVAVLASEENRPTPAFAALQKAWSAVNDYSVTVVAHETTNDGSAAQDRTFVYKFLRPAYVLVQVVSGPGKGGTAVWQGGDTVRGHQSGFLSLVKVTLPKGDARATSLRGDQIDAPSIAYVIGHFLTTPGMMTDAPAGDRATTVTFVPANPETGGVTKETLTLDNVTHFPVRRAEFVDSKVVENEAFEDMHINPGLAVQDFEN